MKTKKGFVIRNICGESVIVAEGKENIDFTKIISMNESCAYLWKAVEGTTFDADRLARLLTQEYEVDSSTAQKDSEHIIREWQNAGIIE